MLHSAVLRCTGLADHAVLAGFKLGVVTLIIVS